MNYVRLGDLCVINSGGTPRRNNESYWKNGDIPWVKISDLNNGVVESTEEFITLDGLKNSSAKIFPQGTLLYTIFATIGEVAILNIDAATNQAIVGLQLKENQKVYLKYIYYYLKSQTNIIKQLGRGVAQNNINLSVVKNMIIPIVSLEKQSNIIATLSKLEKIKENRIIISNYLDSLIKSRFVEMFGNPIINDKKYPIFKLKDISQKIGSGFTPRGGDSNYIEEGIAFIRSMNIYNNTFKKENLAYIDEFLANQLSQVELFSGDLLLNITGASVARCCTVPDNILPARVNQHVCIIRQCRISNVFLEYCLTNESYQEYLLLLSNKNGATREALTKSQVENLEVIFPPLLEIARFEKIVEQINKLKSDVQKSINETQLLMDSLMQEYFG